MKPEILSAVNLSYTIKSNHIFEKKWSKTLWKIKNLSLQNPGLVVVAGRNGAGKSTLLRCLLGLLKAQTGEVLWNDKKKFNQNDLGYIPEFPVLPPSIPVRQWLSWLMTDKEFKNLLNSTQADPLFQRLSVESFLDVPADQLSKGQQQRVQLWTALAFSPPVLVLDEPFSGLDPWARQQLSHFLIQVLDAGRTVIMSTHEVTQELRHRTLHTWLIENEGVTVHDGCALPE